MGLEVENKLKDLRDIQTTVICYFWLLVFRIMNILLVVILIFRLPFRKVMKTEHPNAVIWVLELNNLLMLELLNLLGISFEIYYSISSSFFYLIAFNITLLLFSSLYLWDVWIMIFDPGLITLLFSLFLLFKVYPTPNLQRVLK